MPSHEYVCFNIERANAVFSKQLGSLWGGYDALQPLERALYAVFCAQAAGQQREAWKMIERLAFSFKEGQVSESGQLISEHTADTSGTDELLKKYADLPEIKLIEQLHAHTINVFVGVLALARKKGRLMHANFLWLKPVNRTLWYALCGQGGQCPYWEAAGPWAHAQIEQLMGKRITVPMVIGAIEALRDTMSREHWIDPGEYSQEYQQKMVQAANAMLDDAARQQGQGGRQGNGGGLRHAQKNNRRNTAEDEP